jgi:hypothetical protein
MMGPSMEALLGGLHGARLVLTQDRDHSPIVGPVQGITDTPDGFDGFMDFLLTASSDA